MRLLLSLLDPRLWIVAALGLGLAFLAGDLRRGASDRLAWQAHESRIAAESAERLAAATERLRETERAMTTQVANIASQHIKEIHHAQTHTARLVAGIRARRIRLYVATRAADNAADRTNPSPAFGNRDQARAELDPATAEALVGIATEGDAAIRELNACLDAYQVVRQAMDWQARHTKSDDDLRDAN